MLTNENITIELDKLTAVLEHFLSLHEADEISYMITDECATIEDIKSKLRTYESTETE